MRRSAPGRRGTPGDVKRRRTASQTGGSQHCGMKRERIPRLLAVGSVNVAIADANLMAGRLLSKQFKRHPSFRRSPDCARFSVPDVPDCRPSFLDIGHETGATANNAQCTTTLSREQGLTTIGVLEEATRARASALTSERSRDAPLSCSPRIYDWN